MILNEVTLKIINFQVFRYSGILEFIKKEYWNIGVGTELMKTLIDFAKTNGKTEIMHLGVKADNISAIKLYNKFGFEEIGIYKKFFKIDGIYYDEVLMNLYL